MQGSCAIRLEKISSFSVSSSSLISFSFLIIDITVSCYDFRVQLMCNKTLWHRRCLALYLIGFSSPHSRLLLFFSPNESILYISESWTQHSHCAWKVSIQNNILHRDNLQSCELEIVPPKPHKPQLHNLLDIVRLKSRTSKNEGSLRARERAGIRVRVEKVYDSRNERTRPKEISSGELPRLTTYGIRKTIFY